MNQNERAFIERVLPWPVGEEPGWVNIHWTTAKIGPSGKPYWGGAAVKLSGDFVGQLAFRMKSDNVRDLYICMSRQAQQETKKAADGREFQVAARSQADALALKSLYLDIDVKEGAYATRDDAITALKALADKLALPTPTAIVASGSGGLHVYWSLETAITRDEWQPLADALAYAATQHGLLFDQQCTIDSARILRIPGTMNYKGSAPRPVELIHIGTCHTLEALSAPLAPFIGKLPSRPTPAGNADSKVDVSALTPRTPITGNDDLVDGVTTSLPDPTIDQVAVRCGFIKDALATGGAGHKNPEWMMAAYTSAFVQDGRDALTRMAGKHPSYTDEENDRIHQRMVDKRAGGKFGWPNCAAIAGAGSAACPGCPLLVQGKSPFHFVETAPVPPPAANDTPAACPLPTGYFRGEDGRIYTTRPAEPGAPPTTTMVFPYAINDAWLQEDPWVLHFTTVVTHGRKKKVSLELARIATNDGFTKSFAELGMMLQEHLKRPTKEFIVAFVQKLQQTKDAVIISTPFGWAVNASGKIEGFTYAGKMWSDVDPRPAASADPEIAKIYTPRGELTPWVTAAKLITGQRRPDLDAILAAAFAAPLVRFTGHSGAMMNAYSPESGIGKSSAMKVAQSVWGNPVLAMQGLDDTSGALFHKVGRLNVLPVFWDELKTEEQTKRFVVMSFTLTGGKEKSRLTSNITQRETGTWQTLLVSASNDSIIDAMVRATKSTTAGLYRCFEYPVRKVEKGGPGQIEAGVAARRLGALNEHFGHAGLTYAQFLGANPKRVEREVAEMQDMLTREVDAGNDERFWLVVMATVLLGARYANELGLTDIDEAGLRQHMLNVLERMRDEVANSPTDMSNQMSVSNILAQFMKATAARHTLVTNRMHIGKGRPPTKDPIKVMCDVGRLDGIQVHIGKDNHRMRISSTFMSQWMHDNHYSRAAFMKALKEEYGCRETYAKLGAGTEHALPTEYVLDIDLGVPGLRGLMSDLEEDYEEAPEEKPKSNLKVVA